MKEFPKRTLKSKWYQRPFNSMIHCMSIGMAGYNCEAHVPQYLSVGSILMAIESSIGHTQLGAKTLFVNAEHSLGDREIHQACQFKARPEDIASGNIHKDARFCNWSPSSESNELITALYTMFPNPSRYEDVN